MSKTTARRRNEKLQAELRQLRAAWDAAVNKVLPGDHIHHEAPISRGKDITGRPHHDTRAMMDALDAAAIKRFRKMQRNLKVKA